MRLIELRLKNLNSLKGEWHIDFTNPAFVNEGIFAITGQTGAGKTTILDAICLALYSRTPRLGDITGSTNEMMTQGTGECSAEVVIEIGDKHYRCSWYQHRAHKKPKGNLLPIKHEISVVETKKILEEKKSKTMAYIQDLIGMDFNQFTRSIMLAQGSFAAFLKSDVADRAAILEKITGTAIYADISKNVFEKKREEESELTKLQAGIDNLPLLSIEDEAQLIAGLKAHESAQNTQRQAFKTVNEHIQWLDKVADLKQNLSHYQTVMTTALQDEKGFTPDAARLDAANKALEIDSPFRELIYSRDMAKRLNNEQQDLLGKIPAQKELLDNTTTDLNIATRLEEQVTKELHDTLPIIAKVRELDAEIKQQLWLLSDDNQRRNSLLTNTQQLNQEINVHKNTEQDTNNKLASVRQYLINHHELNDLDTDIALFNSNGSRLKVLLQDNATLITNRQTYQDQATHLQKNINELNRQQAVDKLLITNKRDQLKGLHQQQTNLLQDSSLHNMRSQQEHIDHINSQIERVSFKLQQLAVISTQIETINITQPNVKQELNSLEGLVSDNEAKITDAKGKRREKQEHLNLLQKVAKLEDYISELESSKPCPLCGSVEHPYSDSIHKHPLLANGTQGENSPISQAEQQSVALDKLIDELEKILSEANIDYATKKNNLINNQKQLTVLHHQVKTLYSDIQGDITSLLGTDVDFSGSVKAIINSFNQINNDINTLNQQLESGTADIEPIEHLLLLVSSAKQSLTQEKDLIKTTLAQYDNFTQTISNVSTAIDTEERQQQTLSNEVSNFATEIKLNSQRTAGLDNTVAANFSELTEITGTVLAVIDKYSASNDDLSAETPDNSLKPSYSLKPLTDSIHNKIVLNIVVYNELLDSLRQQRSALMQLKEYFNTQKVTQQNLLTTLSGLSTQIDAKQTQLDSLESELKNIVTLIADKTTSLNQLQKSRKEQFNNKDTEGEENLLRTSVDDAKSKRAMAQRHQDSAKQALKQLQDRAQQLSAELDTATHTLTAQENNFATLLVQSQFANEANFGNARLPKKERDMLKQRQSSIEQALNHAKMQLNNTQNSLNEQLSNPLTSENLDTLAGRYLQLQADIERRFGEIGAIEQQLKANDEQKGAQTAQNVAIDAQKEKMQVWQQLYDLIGSADGKKYRTFAQGLTFQVMINHANAQLQKMSDRYLLIHDNNNALELNVIDNYQGGDIRSTKNLSGGEGFIISLALALGLSQMASQNIRVDSLFLDEGFGTLDEESLDIALDTLTSLQQEGKLIGIISHVQALKERIMTQIQVKKISGGFSEISGQGCHKIAS
ncbi:AAA family ATPase [Psychrobacter urativorans]|uniref:AAA family ATPase n=1 Tax=Psychrobacter urativorans TaxID=45610 RepID=UPI00191A9B34|nr:AAA family ATPase [Psychrobacter urativorans]